MSFTTQVKEDLTRVVSSKPCCRRAEFLAFFLINGSMRISGGLSLVMETENSAVARKMFVLAKDFDLEREISTYRRSRLRKNQVFRLTIPAQAQLNLFLRQLGVLSGEQAWQLDYTAQLREKFLREVCCQRAFLRGAFLASGSVSQPERSSYHLEFDSLDKGQSELLVELLHALELSAKTLRRKEQYIVYLKGAEQVSDFLNQVGSHRSMLELESVRVTKEMRNQANRLRNCDNANVNKTVAAAERQCEEIDVIVAALGWTRLPQNLRIVAELRQEHPDASLSELSQLSGLGRSALNHRLRRLSEIAGNIRDFGPEEWNRQD